MFTVAVVARLFGSIQSMHSLAIGCCGTTCGRFELRNPRCTHLHRQQQFWELPGNGETRQRARKGMRLVVHEPNACTPKNLGHPAPHRLSQALKSKDIDMSLAKHARPGNLHSLLDFNVKKLYRWYWTGLVALVYIVAGGFVSERSEHFSCAGRAAGNGETRQRARKGMRLVGYEPKACTPKPWTSCTPSLESSSQGYSHGSMQYFWMTVGDTNAEAYSSCHPPSHPFREVWLDVLVLVW